jgi:hypothetical protein
MLLALKGTGNRKSSKAAILVTMQDVIFAALEHKYL